MASARTCSLLLFPTLALCAAAIGNAAGRAELGGSHVNGLEPFLQSLLGGASKAHVAETTDVGREATFRRFAEAPAYLTIKFHVPPHEYENFVNKWSSLERTCVKDKGNVMFDLKKTVTDNVYFLAYSEWETRIDLFYHMISDHFQDFVEFANSKNIMWELIPMRPVTDTKQERRANRMNGVDSNNVEKKSRRSGKEVHFLTKILLKPCEADKFVDMWEDTAARTIQEEGNAVYSLRKVAQSNVEFYIYGTWDSYADLSDHLSSKHVRKLLNYALDRDIVLMRTPLLPYDEALLGDEPTAV